MSKVENRSHEITTSFQYGDHEVTLGTGLMAKQSTRAVTVRMGGTFLLVTVVIAQSAQEGRDFLPLTVNYQEKSYAVGRIPGGYFKREGRPSNKESLIARLIDRPVRPLFAKGFAHDIQLIVTVLSADPDLPTDVPALLGASAALSLSGTPFAGPLGAARVGYINGEYVLNPGMKLLTDSALDLVVAGTRDAVLMVESSANELSESVMLDAVVYGHQSMQTAIDAIHTFMGDVNDQKTETDALDWTPPAHDDAVLDRVTREIQTDLESAYQMMDKTSRQSAVSAIRERLLQTLCADNESVLLESEVLRVFYQLERAWVRQQILSGKLRIDGRDRVTVRPIHIQLGLLPSTHGSALFTRGETQALTVSALGTDRDAQIVDDLLQGDVRENFICHYNFPPFSVGEQGFMGGPKRREIGHGALVRRALTAILPDAADFPYVLRVVSEILESNGSSSMASVCASSLSMMDAGVPIKAAVAGIAMGLIKEGDQYAILTDILGDEDHLGDMDFKVAGTANGVTALQMDIKIQGITKDIMEEALEQAKAGRMHILSIMNQMIDAPREELSPLAPRFLTMKINPEKIRDVIGKGGSVIREIIDATNSTIDITDDGMVKIASVNIDDAQAAKKRIEDLTLDVKEGQVYEGVVNQILKFGAIVQLGPNRQGLVHISQIANERVEDVHDYLKEGQSVRVKVIEIDRQGRVRLSLKEVDE